MVTSLFVVEVDAWRCAAIRLRLPLGESRISRGVIGEVEALGRRGHGVGVVVCGGLLSPCWKGGRA